MWGGVRWHVRASRAWCCSRAGLPCVVAWWARHVRARWAGCSSKLDIVEGPPQSCLCGCLLLLRSQLLLQQLVLLTQLPNYQRCRRRCGPGGGSSSHSLVLHSSSIRCCCWQRCCCCPPRWCAGNRHCCCRPECSCCSHLCCEPPCPAVRAQGKQQATLLLLLWGPVGCWQRSAGCHSCCCSS